MNNRLVQKRFLNCSHKRCNNPLHDAINHLVCACVNFLRCETSFVSRVSLSHCNFDFLTRISVYRTTSPAVVRRHVIHCKIYRHSWLFLPFFFVIYKQKYIYTCHRGDILREREKKVQSHLAMSQVFTSSFFLVRGKKCTFQRRMAILMFQAHACVRDMCLLQHTLSDFLLLRRNALAEMQPRACCRKHAELSAKKLPFEVSGAQGRGLTVTIFLIVQKIRLQKSQESNIVCFAGNN